MFHVAPPAYPPVREAPAGHPHEIARQRAVLLAMIIYWMFVYEGAVRKWVLPEIHQYISFMRDPLALLCYYQALRSWRLDAGPLTLSVALVSISFTLLAGLQSLSPLMPPIISLYGLRNYLLYIPMMLVVSRCFDAADILKIMKTTFWFSTLLAALAVVQFLSPVTSFINKTHLDGVYIFQVIDGVVRTTGTFPSSLVYSTYLSFVAALVMGGYLSADIRKNLGAPILVAAGGAVLVALLVSGSRTAFLSVGVVVAVGVLSSLFRKRTALQSRGLLSSGASVLVIGLVVLSLSSVLSTALSALVERQSGAVATEGATFDRVARMVTEVGQAIDEASVAGAGLGAGSNAAVSLAIGFGASQMLYENELPRIIQEAGPLMGIAYILFRWGLALLLLLVGIRSLFKNGNPLAMCLFGSSGLLLLVGQTTANVSLSYFIWFVAGLTLASARMSSPAELSRRAMITVSTSSAVHHSSA